MTPKTPDTQIQQVDIPCNLNRCRSCPFGGEEPIHLDEHALNSYYTDVVTFRGSHHCHTTDNQTLCRGARELQKQVAFAMGWIGEQTDDAFEAEMRKTEA